MRFARVEIARQPGRIGSSLRLAGERNDLSFLEEKQKEGEWRGGTWRNEGGARVYIF